MKTHPQVEADLHEIISGLGDDIYRFEGKTVLISGACGFLGSWFTAVFDYLNTRMFKDPTTVYALDSFIATDERNNITEITSPYINFIRQDISTAPFYPYKKIDFIIHAAGIASPIYYRKYPRETVEGMAIGLYRLLKYAEDHIVERFLNFSSSEAYGNPDEEHVPMTENYNGNVSTIGPRSCYDESKRFGETMAAVWASSAGVPITSVRPFNVYGPGMRIKDDRVVPKFIFQILRGEPITVHTPGTQTRTFCYITDAMVGFFLALLYGKFGEFYNIGREEEEMNIVKLAETMKQKFEENVDVKKIPMPKEYPTDQAQRRCPSILKANKDLGYYSHVTLWEGLGRSMEWAKYVFDEHMKLNPSTVSVKLDKIIMKNSSNVKKGEK